MNIQWYPGHMTKARRAMQEDIKLIDLIIELVDARVPISSRNPDIDELGRQKARLVLLNKADLAGDKGNDAWIRWFKEQGVEAVKLDSRSRAGLKQIQEAIAKACKEKIERDRRRGILNRPVRAMVVGIPNVGKSTFINSYAGKACARTGNKPGVTKGNQWIRLNKSVELLDTPGILWPRFESEEVGVRLALIGSINDQILDRHRLAMELIRILEADYPGTLRERYGVETESEDAKIREDGDGSDGVVKITDKRAGGILEDIGRVRGCLMKGGQCDTEKAAGLMLDDFRSGKLGRITLEFPLSQEE